MQKLYNCLSFVKDFIQGLEAEAIVLETKEKKRARDAASRNENESVGSASAELADQLTTPSKKRKGNRKGGKTKKKKQG
jgi:hypothetical protein